MQSQEVLDVFAPFLSIRAWGLIPYALLMALEGDWIGQAKTRPLLPLALLMASINMALDAYWVEGLWVEGTDFQFAPASRNLHIFR